MAAAATPSVDKKVVSRDHNTLFRTFLEIYLENISNSFTTSKQGNQDSTSFDLTKFNRINNNNGNRNRNKTKKNNNNNISKKVYDMFVELVSNLYRRFDLKSINDNILHTFFSQYYETIKNYYDNIKTKENSVQRCYYLDCHGNVKKEISIVPANVVLIFLTPINRYSICDYWNNTLMTEFFNNQNNLIMFQQNFSCIDKINIWYPFNNRSYHQGYELFTNSIFFLPGQKFYDLDLSYSKTDLVEHNMGSFMFPKVAGTVNKENYGDTFKQVLSVYVSEKAKIDPDKIKYIIVKCCRNIDSDIQKKNNNKIETLDFYNDAFIYENLLQYYNIIMLGNFNNIGSKHRQKTASYEMFSRGRITKKKLVDEHMQELINLFRVNCVKYIHRLKDPYVNRNVILVDADIEPEKLSAFISTLFDNNNIELIYSDEEIEIKINNYQEVKKYLVEFFRDKIHREESPSIMFLFERFLYNILNTTSLDLKKQLESVSPKLQSFKNTKRSYRLGHVGRRFLETKLRSIHDGSYTANSKISQIVDKLLPSIYNLD